MWEIQTCDACGSDSRFAECFGSVWLCKKCSVLIGSPSWKEEVHSSNEEVDERKSKVIRRAERLRFSERAIEGLAEYFEDQKADGLIVRFDGGRDQTISVFETHLEINTDENFDFRNAQKEYGRAVRARQGGASAIGSNGIDANVVAGIAKDALGGIALGGAAGLTKTLLKAGAGIAGGAIAGSIAGEASDAGSTVQTVRAACGTKRFEYSYFEDAEFVKPAKQEESAGFIVLRKSAAKQSQEDRFFCYGSFCEKDARKIHAEIRERVLAAAAAHRQQAKDEALAKKARKIEAERARDELIIAAVNSSSAANQVSVPDEIMKFKQLFDAGVITQEEFSQAKARLLGM